MKKKNTLLTKIVAITFLFMLMINNVPISNAATEDSIAVTVTVNSVLSITDGDDSITVSINPGSADTTQSTTLTVSSNDPQGFDIKALLADSGSTAGRLNSGTNYFSGDDGTTSYIEVTSTAGSGITPGTYNTANLGGSEVSVLDTTDDSVTDGTVAIAYEIGADNTILPATYTGTITFTITGKA